MRKLSNSTSYIREYREIKQLTGLWSGALEVRDEHFAVATASDLLRGVGEIDPLDVECLEDRAHFGNVVQGQDEFAAQFSEQFRHLPEVVGIKVELVELAA